MVRGMVRGSQGGKMFTIFAAKRVRTVVVWQCFSVLFVNKSLPSKDVGIRGWDIRADLVCQII